MRVLLVWQVGLPAPAAHGHTCLGSTTACWLSNLTPVSVSVGPGQVDGSEGPTGCVGYVLLPDVLWVGGYCTTRGLCVLRLCMFACVTTLPVVLQRRGSEFCTFAKNADDKLILINHKLVYRRVNSVILPAPCFTHCSPGNVILPNPRTLG